jgi:hypothetical protein
LDFLLIFARSQFFLLPQSEITCPPYLPTKVMFNSTHDEKGIDGMKRYWTSFGILAVLVLAANSPALAHDECDDEDQPKVASAERGESMGSQPQPGTNVTIKLFQYQPGRIQARVGTMVTWLNEDEIFHTVTAGEPDKKGGD